MNKLILKLIGLSLTAVVFLTSCESKESLQQYYIDHSEQDGFIATSIPKTITGIDASKLTPASAEAYNSISKISLLALPLKDDNKDIFNTESEKLDKILSDDKYELLMSHKDDNMKIQMVYDGTQDAIDEIIVYGKSNKMGFGVARVLGTDMKVGAIMQLMKELEGQNLNVENINGVIEGMGFPTSKSKPSDG